MITYGTITVTDMEEGSQIWTATAAPSSPNYTFTISSLVGDSSTSVKTGDIILYSYYRYTVLSVSDTTVFTGNRQSIRGETGQASITYGLILSSLAIVKDKNGNLSPASITLTAKSQSGSNAMANYSGRFKIETTTDNSTWTARYTSSANESTKTYTLPTDIIAIRCSLYLAGGTSTLLDQQTVPVVSDGANGTSVSITSTSVTYQSGTSGTTKPTGTWQTTVPSVSQGNYLWTKTIVNYSDGSSTESYSVARQGNNGSNGTSPTVSTTTVQYQQSTNGSTPPSGTWSDNPPTAIAGQYMWTKTIIKYSDNAEATSYSVSKNGTNGTNGSSVSITSTSVTYQSGTSGTSKPTGTWQTTIPSVAQGNYLWTKTVVNYSDGTSTESYSAARQGSNGTNGTNGTSPTVSSTVVEYQQSTDGKNIPTGTWSTTPPTAVAGQYIWTRTTITYSDNATAVSYSVSRNGTNGTSISISSTAVTYQKGTSGTTKPTGTWQSSIPSVGQGEYLWTKTVVTYSDTSNTESYSVSRNAVNGTNGTNGRDGVSPTVSSTVTEYVQSDSGTNTPTSGWNTTPPSATAGKYMWTKVTVTYSDNATAISYTVSKNGTNGTNGINTATVYLYKKGTTAPSVPSGNTTYTFSTKVLTGTLDNWTQEIPTTGSGQCYVTAAVASSNGTTDTIGTGEWSIPIQFNGTNGINGTNGTNGLNQATIFLYKRGASVTKPTTSVTYTFSTGELSAEPNDWTRNIPTINGSPCWVVSATAINSGTTATIAGSNWSAPVKLVEDGIDGEDAYTVSLSNDNHTFAGDTTKAIQADVDCSVIGFKGATQIAVTIGTITGQPTGMTTSITNNGTTNAYFTVSVTTAMTTRNGVLTIPVTIDGKSFTKKFTYSLALKGDKGDKGDSGGIWYSGTAITGTSTTATVFSNSGITSAVVGDMYLNTTTYNTYRCTVAGNASTAKWVYVNNIKGGIGNTGKGISSIKNQYYLSTSNTGQAGGSWTDTVPTYVSDRYYWTRSYIVWSDNTNTTTNPVLDNALTSANSTAKQAKDIADNTAQYFWVSSDTTDSGVHITEVPQTDFIADRENGGGNLLARSNGIVVRDGLSELAKFGSDGVVIGDIDNLNIKITNDRVLMYSKSTPTIQLITGDEVRPLTKTAIYITFPSSAVTTGAYVVDSNENNFFKYSIRIKTYFDIYTSNNSTPISCPSFTFGTSASRTIVCDSSSEQYDFSCSCTIEYDGAYTFTIKNWTCDNNIRHVDFYIEYDLEECTPNVVLGTTDATSFGAFSVTEGNDCQASGDNSHAEGEGSKAIGIASHAEGLYTKARGSTSHTEGYLSESIGLYSHAQNYFTIAASDYQTAIGKFNISDSSDTYSFIIGNGTSNSARSDAFRVGWDGNVQMYLDTTSSVGLDYDILTAIQSLGWENDVID